MENKAIIGMLILSIFAFVLAASSLYVQIHVQKGNLCGCFIPLPLFIPFVGSIGLFIGTLAFYLISPPTKQKKNTQIVLKLLDEDEAKVMETILKNKGKATQSEITKELNFPKVKTFRIIERLKSKGIVKKEGKGRIKSIELSDEFKKFFFE